jgi:predicted nucleotidyltransferase
MGKAKRKSNRSTLELFTPLLEPLGALQRLLERFENRGVIIGGVAASLLGQPRLTADLDAVILMSTQDLPRLIEIAANEGLKARISDAEDFARKRRVLLLQHETSGIKIDISLGILPFEVEMVERGQEIVLGSLSVRLPTPEDLIIMKAVAYRPKDLEDIRAVAASHPDLDRERIRDWVEQFGEALDRPGLWNDILKIIESA